MSEYNPNANEVSQPSVGAVAGPDNGPATVSVVPDARTLTGWQKFKLIFKVIEVRLRFIAILIAVAFFVGYWDTIKNHWEKATRSDGGRGRWSTKGRKEAQMVPWSELSRTRAGRPAAGSRRRRVS